MLSTPRENPKFRCKLAARSIWTDGSACHSSEPSFRRASVAVIFEGGQEVVYPLPGSRQSV
eukprot:936380-Amphidinium_carterae.1